MSPAPHAPRTARRCAWPRVLALLLVLFLPAAHAQAGTAPAVAVTAETGDQDFPESVSRALARRAHRPPAPPLHGPPPPHRARPRPVAAARPVPPHPPYAPLTRRSVVLRC